MGKLKPIFTLKTLSVLFSTVYQNRIIFQGFLRQLALSTDPRLQLSTMSIEQALTHVLDVFCEMWIYISMLIRDINKINATLTRRISEEFPQHHAAGIGLLLPEYLCIRNQDILGRTQLSTKTAIKYLKQLENGKILYSVKNGREIYYFNNTLVGILEQQISRYTENGA